MGRARIGAILAALRSALAGLLLIALLLGDAMAPAAAAPWALAAQLGPIALEATLQPSLSVSNDAALTQTGPALTAGEVPSRQPASPLERRLQQWPAWRLPAPLPRPGRQAPLWPGWFSGEWQVESVLVPDEPGDPSPIWQARFRADGQGGAVADRACNALAVGRSLLGERLLSVQDDPANPQRQLARLTGDALLETTLIGQRGESPAADRFLNDELSLEVLHGPGEPRVSRIETLGRWRLLADGSIAGEQWQARYGSPADGLATAALTSDHWRIRLVPVPPGSDRATETAVAAAGCR